MKTLIKNKKNSQTGAAKSPVCQHFYSCVWVPYASFNTSRPDGGKRMLLMDASDISFFSPQEYFSHLNLAQLENINDC